MEPVLDDKFNDEAAVDKTQLTGNKRLRVILYFIVMLVGNALYYIFIARKDLSGQFISFTVSTILGCMVVSAFLEIIRFFLRRRKEQKKNLKIKQDPLWFKIYEGGFSIWILIAVTVGLDQLFILWLKF